MKLSTKVISLVIIGGLSGLQMASAQNAQGRWGFCGSPVPPPAARALQLAGSNEAALQCVVSQYRGSPAASTAQLRLTAIAEAQAVRQKAGRDARETALAAARTKKLAKAKLDQEQIQRREAETRQTQQVEQAAKAAKARTKSLADAEARRPRTVTVSIASGADYRNVQQAIDATPAGSTILIQPGTYAGPLKIEKNLNLRGIAAAAKPVLTSSSTEQTMLIEDQARVTIEDLEIRNTGNGDAVKVWGDARPTFRRVKVGTAEMTAEELAANPTWVNSRGRDGVYIQSGSVVIENCIVETPSGTAIEFYSNSGGVVRNTQINRSWRGILLFERANPVIEENMILGSIANAIFVGMDAKGQFLRNLLEHFTVFLNRLWIPKVGEA